MDRSGEMNPKETELRLALPGTSDDYAAKRQSSKRMQPETSAAEDDEPTTAPRPKAQIVGWPPVRSYRKNALQAKTTSEGEKATGNYVKVSVDGAPFLRKIDLGVYKGYGELLVALEIMFRLTIGEFSETAGYKKGCSQYEPTYEDKDGDWMLVGDVPWEMFMSSCKRLRITKQK